ncbi:MAG: hypothetical protein AAGA91_10285 [Pseudomonadota bacterium]
MPKNTSVPVNGERVYADRKRQQLSIAALVEKSRQDPKSIQVSKSTFERAERGESIRRSSLRAIADLLGQPYERYVKNAGLITGSSADISGAWIGYFLEPDSYLKLQLVSIESQFRQQGAVIEEVSAIVEREGDRSREICVEAQLIDDLLITKHYVEGWTQPSGISCTMLKLTRGNCVLTGHTMWYDLDTEKIESSPNVMVKKDSEYFEDYLKIARQEVSAQMGRV